LPTWTIKTLNHTNQKTINTEQEKRLRTEEEGKKLKNKVYIVNIM